MRTVWILDHYATEPQYGGISRQYDFANELDRRGIRVVVVASSFSHVSHSYFQDEPCTIRHLSQRVSFVYLRTKPAYQDNGSKRFMNMLSYVHQVKRYSSYIAKQCAVPDTVLGCSIHPLAWLAANYCAKHFNAKFMIEVRDFWPLFFIESDTYSKQHPVVLFFGRLEKWAYKRAEKIIVSLPFAERYLCGSLSVPAQKVTWIGQPMDCNRFDALAERYEEFVPTQIKAFIKDAFVCVFAGYYKTYEGVHTMLAAALLLQKRGYKTKMLFVGHGEEKDVMRQYVAEHQLKNVLIENRLPKEAIPSLLRKCQVKLASLYLDNEKAFAYGISKNKINEYLYSGGCTILGFAHGQSAVDLSGGGYVIPPNDPEALADSIVRASQLSKEVFDEIDAKARVYIRREHGVDVLAAKLESILFD